MIFQKVLFCDNNLRAARGTSWEFIVIPWTRTLTVRMTESSRKSRDHLILSLETEKKILIYSGLKVYEMRLEKNNCGQLYQPMESRHDYAKNGIIFASFDTRSGVLDCDW